MKKEKLYNKFLVTIEAEESDFMGEKVKLNSAKLALQIGGKIDYYALSFHQYIS